MTDDLYIGLMSGTSLDGIDAVVTCFKDHQVEVIASSHTPYPDKIKSLITSLISPGHNEIEHMIALDVQLGQLYASTVNELLEVNNMTTDNIKAIGSHGQTLRHYPDTKYTSTLQVGDPNIITELTGITTVADFRRRDMAAGGQGAPLVPAFHNYLFRSTLHDRVILNIGGIANITILPADITKPVSGFDTGPGNTFLNFWIKLNQNKEFDQQGHWAASGTCHTALLENLLSDDYFTKQPPKSTGTEYFSHDWLKHKLSSFTHINAEDIQNTLATFTVISISDAIKQHASTTKEIIICGGGVHNHHLVNLLKQHLSHITIKGSADYQLDPDFIEASAFAWLAKQTLEHNTGNCPSVTGAKRNVILGSIYQA